METNANGKKYLVVLLLGLFLYFLGAIIYTYSSYQVISLVNPNFVFSSDDPLYEEYLCLVQITSNIPVIILFVLFLKDDIVSDFKGFFEKKKKNIGYILLGVVGCYLLNMVVALIYELFGNQGVSDNQEVIENALLSDAKVYMILAVVLIAPFVEEIIFRKLIFGVLENNFKFPPIVSIIASTLVFSLIHVPDLENIIYIFQYIPLAFVITFSYYKSDRNIFVPIGIHFLNNLVSVIAVYALL